MTRRFEEYTWCLLPRRRVLYDQTGMVKPHKIPVDFDALLKQSKVFRAVPKDVRWERLLDMPGNPPVLVFRAQPTAAAAFELLVQRTESRWSTAAYVSVHWRVSKPWSGVADELLAAARMQLRRERWQPKPARRSTRWLKKT